MGVIAVKDLRLQLHRLLQKHPDALLVITEHGYSIVKLHDEDETHYREPYYLPLGHIDASGHVHLLAED